MAEPVHELAGRIEVGDPQAQLAGVGQAQEPAQLAGQRRHAHHHVAAGVDQDRRPVAVAQDEPLEVRADDRHRVERGVELGAQAHEQEQRALEDDRFLGHVEALRQLAQRDVHLAQVGQALEALLEGLLGIELQVLQVQGVERDALAEAIVEVLDDLLEDPVVRAAGDEAHLPHRADDPAGVAGEPALDQLDDAGAELRRDRRDRAEVEEHQLGAVAGGGRADQQVPGVWIGVIDAVGEDLLAVDLDHLAGQGAAIEAELLAADRVGDLDPGLEAGGQHPRGRAIAHHLGERDVLAIGEVGGDAIAVVGLGAEVELGQDDRADLAVDVLEALVRHEPLDDAEDALECPQIVADDLLDVGVLDLDRDRLARGQGRAVDLADRRRRDRHPLEGREHRLGLTA
jgi:hypothetical protein